ncbi:TPA: molecular chaperone DnaJ [Candidatus Woesearchaeota archaeon]|nr:molecular chaperone DnaJ [Candidatus Woesearchaeota archaeon]
MTKDYYETLGISKSASKEDIKKAYKQLAKKYHPDINKDAGAQEKFKEINEAASVLGDDEKRKQYDQFGDADSYRQAFSGARGGFGGFDFSSFGGSFDFDDIFDTFFSGGRGRRRSAARDGADLRYDMEITLEEAAFGTEKEIVIPRNVLCEHCHGAGAESDSDIVTCPDCNGAGAVRKVQRTPFGMFQSTTTCRNCSGSGKSIRKRCHECGGSGSVHKESIMQVKIPAGSATGTNLRIVGGGEAGQREGSPGDLYIVLHVKKHKHFERDSDDLYIKVPLAFTTAALGGEITVPTLKEDATLKVPSGTQSNTIFRMRGKGISHLHGSGAGDQLVEVVVYVPDKLSKKAKKMLEDFEKEVGKKGLLGKLFS